MTEPRFVRAPLPTTHQSTTHRAHRRSPLRLAPIAFLGLVVLLVAPLSQAEAQARVPEEFTNLEVLPSDIGQRELINIMRGFTSSLGVGRCSYCHTVSDGLDQPDDDFTSDEKAAKKTARQMLQMVAAINNDHLAGIADRSALGIEVTCVTCHAGRNRPATLIQELMQAQDEGGTSALETRYAELRERYYGLGAYNFGPAALETIARGLQEQDPGSALAVIDLNLEYHSESAQSWLTKGVAHEALEQTEQAIAAYERSIELAPRNPVAVQALERLRGA